MPLQEKTLGAKYLKRKKVVNAAFFTQKVSPNFVGLQTGKVVMWSDGLSLS